MSHAPSSPLLMLPPPPFPTPQVLKMADVFEGSLVRAIRRLEELLRQVMAGGRGERGKVWQGGGGVEGGKGRRARH